MAETGTNKTIVIILVLLIVLCLCCTLSFVFFGFGSGILAYLGFEDYDTYTSYDYPEESYDGYEEVSLITNDEKDPSPEVATPIAKTKKDRSEKVCDHPNGDIELWWNKVSQDIRNCYIDKYGFPDQMRAPAPEGPQTMNNPQESVWLYLIDTGALVKGPVESTTNNYGESIMIAKDPNGQKVQITQKSVSDNSAEVEVGFPDSYPITYNLELKNDNWEVVEVIN